MKLNAGQVKQTLTQMDAQVVPDDHPAVNQLVELYGDHTYFLDQDGLKVLEEAESDAPAGEVVSLADWTDSTCSSLRAHKPTSTGVVIAFNQTKH
jgi:hypothetical protein